MTGCVTTHEGTEYTLPALLSWELTCTGGVPCDSFAVRCAYSAEMEPVLCAATRFTAREDGKTVFFGVIDEWSAECGGSGKMLQISGRGMAALLLDNESEAAVYERATTADILRRHVVPYGVVCDGYDALHLNGYIVESGGSEWRALSEFTRRAGGFLPYMTRDGRLILRKERTRPTLSLDGAAVTALKYRDKRYGVLSEVVLIDRKTRTRTRVENSAFRARGGACRRVQYAQHLGAARSDGDDMLARSRAGAETLTVTISGRFEADAGDIVPVSGSALGVTGIFAVAEVTRRMDETGETTVLTLERE